MLGGYYLGQLYLGISGLPAGGALPPHGSSHQLSSDNITLTQKHTLVVENTTHGLTSQNTELTEHKTLIIDNALHNNTADNATLTAHHYLEVANALHEHSSDNITINQKHLLDIEDTLHSLVSDTLGGLINLEPYGFGGGFGAIDGWGVKQFGAINIELPINLSLVVQNATHSLLLDGLDTFIQIFNSIKSGIYIKDFENNGNIKSLHNILVDEDMGFVIISEDGTSFITAEKYSTPNSGTVLSKHSDVGQIAPVAESNHGLLVTKMGYGGSYEQSDHDIINPQGVYNKYWNKSGIVRSPVNTLVSEDMGFILISEDGKSVIVTQKYHIPELIYNKINTEKGTF